MSLGVYIYNRLVLRDLDIGKIYDVFSVRGWSTSDGCQVPRHIRLLTSRKECNTEAN
jgi:hypothetical protein